MPSGQQWYMAIGGHQVGPIAEDEFIANIKSDAGFTDTGHITDNTNLANPQTMAPHEHLFTAFAAGGLKQGILTAWVDQENAHMIITK